MLIATRSFVTHDGYREVRIMARRSYVAEGHDIVLANPTSFKPAPDRPAGVRERILDQGSATIARPRPARRNVTGREAWRLVASSSDCAFEYSPSSARVRLSAAARGQLLAIADQTSGASETGGLLLGSATPDLVEILSVSGPGPNAIREPARYQPDAQHDRSLAARMRAESDGAVTERGIWHSHPRGSIAVPSATDMTYFANLRSVVDGLYTAIIAVPNETGWTLAAFIVRSGFTQARCQRTTMT